MLSVMITSLFLLPLIAALVLAARHTDGPHADRSGLLSPAFLRSTRWTALDDLELALLLGDALGD